MKLFNNHKITIPSGFGTLASGSPSVPFDITESGAGSDW